MPLSEEELKKRDSQRNIGQELLQAIRDVKSGQEGQRYRVQPNDVVAARSRCGLSQKQFAKALNISVRTLQNWEQGNRTPSGAAETLLRIVARYPEVLAATTQV